MNEFCNPHFKAKKTILLFSTLRKSSRAIAERLYIHGKKALLYKLLNKYVIIAMYIFSKNKKNRNKKLKKRYMVTYLVKQKNTTYITRYINFEQIIILTRRHTRRKT